MLNNNSTLKYESPYNGKFQVTQCWNNVMFTLQCCVIKNGYNICCMKQFISDTNIKYIIAENDV